MDWEAGGTRGKCPPPNHLGLESPSPCTILSDHAIFNTKMIKKFLSCQPPTANLYFILNGPFCHSWSYYCVDNRYLVKVTITKYNLWIIAPANLPVQWWGYEPKCTRIACYNKHNETLLCMLHARTHKSILTIYAEYVAMPTKSKG